MKKNYRWGILGAGRIAGKFATALQHTGGVGLYAIASREGEKAAAFARQYAVSRHYEGYEALVTDPQVDIIYIATPHVFHCEQTILSLRNGKAVLCEKPMAISQEEVQKMINTARQQDLFLMEGMWSRFMPVTCKAKELIDAGAIGELKNVQADFGFNSPYDEKGRLYNRQLGGGSLLDVGIYPLFLVSFLLGEPSAIHAVGKPALSGVDEYCHVLLQYPGGETASFFSSISLQTTLTATLTGTKGRIVLHAPWYKATHLSVHYNDGRTKSFSAPHECNGFEYEIREVMDCLGKGFKECPAMPLDFSLQISRTMDTIRGQIGLVY
jgi:predicted dehydrogenase